MFAKGRGDARRRPDRRRVGHRPDATVAVGPGPTPRARAGSASGLAAGLRASGRRGPEYPEAPRPSGSLLDDLAAAADAFRSSAARLRLTNLLGLFVRFWMIVWGLGLVLALIGPLLPLIIVGVGFLLIVGGFWVIWQVVTFWFWYAMWGMRR